MARCGTGFSHPVDGAMAARQPDFHVILKMAVSQACHGLFSLDRRLNSSVRRGPMRFEGTVAGPGAVAQLVCSGLSFERVRQTTLAQFVTRSTLLADRSL